MRRIRGLVVAAGLLASCTATPEGAGSPATSLPDAAPATTTSTAPRDPSPDPIGHVEVAPSDARVLLTPDGTALPVVAVHGDGSFEVVTPCARSATATVGTPVGRADVVIDPGHGGDEQGAVAPTGLTEKDVNLDVARRLRDLLVHEGHEVVLTRTRDQRMTLATRADVAVALHPELFISIHHNAEPDGPSDRPGSETYYQVDSPESKRLAGLVHEELLARFSTYDVGWMADRDAGAKFRVSDDGRDFYGILRRTTDVPTVLSEAAFLSNPAEAALLADPAFRQHEAAALAGAVARFTGTTDPGSGFTEPYPRTAGAGSTGGGEDCVDPPLD